MRISRIGAVVVFLLTQAICRFLFSFCREDSADLDYYIKIAFVLFLKGKNKRKRRGGGKKPAGSYVCCFLEEIVFFFFFSDAYCGSGTARRVPSKALSITTMSGADLHLHVARLRSQPQE